MTTQHESRIAERLPWIAAFAVSIAIGASVLVRAHPHEDAYILFKYARNLAAGHGIVYYPGGPHAEGATDFLWMILLFSGQLLRLDVAYGAVLANAVGTALFVRALTRRIPAGGIWRSATRWSALLILLTGPAFAGYFGFSAMLYCGLVALLYSMVFAALNENATTRWIPWLSLTLALFRPDGVILGACFAALGGVAAVRAKDFRPYWGACTLALLPAIGYAVWRRLYFGLNLPLPLYVKGHSVSTFSFSALFNDPVAALPGLPFNWSWLTSWDAALGIVIGLVAVVALTWRGHARERRWFLLCLVPGVVLLASLSVAWQTQNIGARFQGPVLAMLLVSLYYWTGKARPLVGFVLCIGALAPAAWIYYGHSPRLWFQRGYVNTFAVEMGRILPPERTLALTEAGALSFWTAARVEDLVGLNTPHTALHQADQEYLSTIAPDLMMFYAGTFDIRSRLQPDAPKVVPITHELLVETLTPEGRALYTDPTDTSVAGWTPENGATLAAVQYLQGRTDYDVYAVEFLGNYRHVWAFKKTLPEREALLGVLRRTVIEGQYLSYLQASRSR